MKSSHYTRFLTLSNDILLLINDKSKRGEVNKAIAKEASTLEWYYMECDRLFKEYQNDLHILRLEISQLRVHNKLLEASVEHSITDDIKRMNQSSIEVLDKPTDDQWRSIKDRRNKEKTPINTILKHFELTEEQLKELLP